jgi:general stress protein CsbA
MLIKAAAVALVLFGEMFSIVAEVTASKQSTDGAHHVATFFQMLVFITLAGALLIAGYMIGYIHFRSIWIITAVSVGSISIGQPILTYLLFQQTPTLGPTLASH